MSKTTATTLSSTQSSPRRGSVAVASGLSPKALREAKDRGAELLARGNLEAALDVFREVVKAAPQELACRQKVAEILQKMGKKVQAISEYQATAEAWARAGWQLRAIALCKVILQLEPGHTRTQAFLADLNGRQRATSSSGESAPVASRPVAAPKASAPIEPALVDKGSISLFAALDRQEFLEVLWLMEHRVAQPGELIVREGTPGTSMFIIVDGEADVVRQGEGGQGLTVARIGEGECFGEMALLSEGARLASVVSVGQTVLLELSGRRMEEVIARHPQVGEAVQQFFRERLLTNVMRSNPLFAELPEELQRPLMNAFTPMSVAQGEQIVVRGQPAHALYLLLRGRCTVFHEHVDGRKSSYPEMVEGDVFGEIALLRSKLATASVQAATPCTLLALEQGSLEQLFVQYPVLRQQLESLGSQRLQRTSRLLSGRTVHMGDRRV